MKRLLIIGSHNVLNVFFRLGLLLCIVGFFDLLGCSVRVDYFVISRVVLINLLHFLRLNVGQ